MTKNNPQDQNQRTGKNEGGKTASANKKSARTASTGTRTGSSGSSGTNQSGNR